MESSALGALPLPVEGRRYQERAPMMALGLAAHPRSWEEFLFFPLPGQRRASTVLKR